VKPNSIARWTIWLPKVRPNLARQMAASVHGTVDGLVLVGLGEGFLLGVVYYFAVKAPSSTGCGTPAK
jgi:hypothetical protein